MDQTRLIFAKRNGERGAALITTLMISTLLLGVAGTVILTSSMSMTTSVDSTAELQAYYGAESGLEATLNVLRGNVAPLSGVPAGTLMGYRNAVELNKSNKASDHSTVSRLSGWLPYGNDGRVTPAGANFSYSVLLSDPDDPNGTIRAGDASYIPSRLLVQSMGFGPKGARKGMEMVVERVQFNFKTVAALAMRSADSGTSPMTFEIGDSNAKSYSGHDNAHIEPNLPSFAVTAAIDVPIVDDAITKGSTVQPVRVTQVAIADLPTFLQTADNARTFLNYMQAVARSMGRYYTSLNGYAGSTASPQLTFVNGNCNLEGGSGLLIVTGNLIAHGNPNFDGIVLVLGNGYVSRDGGGSGDIFGSAYVAKFARSWPASENGQPHPFLAPTFVTSGGGNSTFQYDSVAVQKAEDVLGSIVRDVREY